MSAWLLYFWFNWLRFLYRVFESQHQLNTFSYSIFIFANVCALILVHSFNWNSTFQRNAQIIYHFFSFINEILKAFLCAKIKFMSRMRGSSVDSVSISIDCSANLFCFVAKIVRHENRTCFSTHISVGFMSQLDKCISLLVFFIQKINKLSCWHFVSLFSCDRFISYELVFFFFSSCESIVLNIYRCYDILSYEMYE